MPIRLAFLLLLTSMIALSYQHCSVIDDRAFTSVATKSHAGGNGEPYDGKPDVFSRFVPGFLCAGSPGEHSTISGLGGSYVLRKYSEDQCSSSTQSIADDDILISPHTENFIAHLSAIYTAAAIDQGAQGIYTEAWCQVVLRSGEHAMDILTIWDQRTQSTHIQIHRNKIMTPLTATSIRRSLQPDHIQYASSGPSLDLQIFFKIKDGSKFQFMKGKTSGTIQGITLADDDVNCLMGGEFDPIAPELSYTPSSRVFAVGDTVEVSPQVSEKIVSFEVAPPLPIGLHLDERTGTISGSMPTPGPRQVYSITGTTGSGVISRAIELAFGEKTDVGPAQSLERLLSDEPMVDLAPRIWSLTPGHQFSLAGTLTISGDLLVSGNGAVLDAGLARRHFEVLPGGRLHLENLTLQRGRSPEPGGAIHASESIINLKNVRVYDNATTTMHAAGGAIYAYKTSLVAEDSLFETNAAALHYNSGGNGHGGAIAAVSPPNLEIYRCRFLGNRSTTSFGGALHVGLATSHYGRYPVVLLRDSHFEDNKALMGGAVLIDSGGSAYIDRSLFKKNVATVEGGGVSSTRLRQVFITKSQFIDNLSLSGAAIVLRYNLTALIEGNTFSGNTRPSYAYYATSPTLESHYTDLVQMKDNAFSATSGAENCLIKKYDYTNVIRPYSSVTGFYDLGGNKFSDQTCR